MEIGLHKTFSFLKRKKDDRFLVEQMSKNCQDMHNFIQTDNKLLLHRHKNIPLLHRTNKTISDTASNTI